MTQNSEQELGEQAPGKSKANEPKDETEAARDSGQFGADKPGYGDAEGEREPVKRPADKKPNTKGPEFEEGGQYPGTRKAGN